jgi:hypothetical protein
MIIRDNFVKEKSRDGDHQHCKINLDLGSYGGCQFWDERYHSVVSCLQMCLNQMLRQNSDLKRENHQLMSKKN